MQLSQERLQKMKHVSGKTSEMPSLTHFKFPPARHCEELSTTDIKTLSSVPSYIYTHFSILGKILLFKSPKVCKRNQFQFQNSVSTNFKSVWLLSWGCGWTEWPSLHCNLSFENPNSIISMVRTKIQALKWLVQGQGWNLPSMFSSPYINFSHSFRALSKCLARILKILRL